MPGRTAFVATIGLSAFVMFTLELLGGRLVLPVFGGSANVWTTALVLFTGLLFLGYLYAHVVATHLSPRTGAALHLTLAVGAVVLFAIAPSSVADLRVPSMPEALNVILALLLIAGPPMLVLASTTPLLSSWYASRGADPWWLYAVSNLASFAALFVYPLVIEPSIALSLQRTVVLGGLALYAAGVAVIVVGSRVAAPTPRPDGAPRKAAAGGDAAEGTDERDRLAWSRQARWLAVAFVPSGLLAATTNFIATDLVSAPLVWVGPLAIYLASFVIAFSERGRRTLKAVELLVPAAATLLWIPFVLAVGLPVGLMLGIELGGYAVLATALHGRLALDRPAERHLTRFYLIVSAAGLLATAFVALLAPIVFDAIWEYPILVVAAIVALTLLPGPDGREAAITRRWSRPFTRSAFTPARLARVGRDAIIAVAPYVAVGALAWLTTAAGSGFGDATGLLAIGAAAIIVGRTPVTFAIATAAAIAAFTIVLVPPVMTRVRTFYGVTEVRQIAGQPIIAEYHGTTLHGLQYLDARATVPTSYYVTAGPIGDVYSDLRTRVGPATIGIVGLGTGSLMTYTMPGDEVTYFEIDPAVLDIATRGPWFTYLKDAPVEARVVLGDARLSLQDEPEGTYDLLVFDAFSSDAIPAHLLTREAMASFARKLKPDGLMVFHVSNRYYALGPVVTATAKAAGLDAADLSYQPGPARVQELAAEASEWVVVGATEAIERFLPLGWSRLQPSVVLTDDFSDVLRTLR